MSRTLVLSASLALIALLAILTITVAVRNGVDVLVVVSLLILGLMLVGVLGALTSPPPDDG
jgi:hypothetical protein